MRSLRRECFVKDANLSGTVTGIPKYVVTNGNRCRKDAGKVLSVCIAEKSRWEEELDSASLLN